MLIKDLSDQQKDMIKNFKCLNIHCCDCIFKINNSLFVKPKPYNCLKFLLRENKICLKAQATIDIDIQTLEKLCQK